MTDHWTERLSEYLDGELSEVEQQQLNDHLATCPTCSQVLDDLRKVTARAAALEDRSPTEELWPGIARRIAVSTRSEPVVADLGERRRRRTLSFSVPQLIAAGITLVVISAGTVWLALPSRASLETTSMVTSKEAAVAPAVLVGFDIAEYDVAVAELERVLDESRDRLDPRTVRAIEQSLAVIDRAIEEALQALSEDPANSYLSTHLATTMKRKIEILHRVAALTSTAS